MGIVTDFDYNCPKCDNGLEYTGDGRWNCCVCPFIETTDVKPCINPNCDNLIHTYDDYAFCEECREN